MSPSFLVINSHTQGEREEGKREIDNHPLPQGGGNGSFVTLALRGLAPVLTPVPERSEGTLSLRRLQLHWPIQLHVILLTNHTIFLAAKGFN